MSVDKVKSTFLQLRQIGIAPVFVPHKTKNPALFSEKRGCVFNHSTAPSFVGCG